MELIETDPERAFRAGIQAAIDICERHEAQMQESLLLVKHLETLRRSAQDRIDILGRVILRMKERRDGLPAYSLAGRVV